MTTIKGTAKKDKLIGTSGADTITGLSGNDSLVGGLGNDKLMGGIGNDSLDGGKGNDSLIGGTGNDRLVGGEGADKLIGGAGIDTASYAASVSNISVNLATGTGSAGDASGDVLIGIENVQGGAGGDQILGDNAANTLIGNAGNDTIDGGAENDILVGGAGADSISGGNGQDTVRPGFDTVADTVLGGDGWDIVDYSDFRHSVTVTISVASIGTTSGTGGDTLNRIESIIGSSFDDDLTPLAGGEALGGSGNDTLRTGGVFNTASLLRGGPGIDTLLGGATSAVSTYFQIELNKGADVILRSDLTGRDHIIVDRAEFGFGHPFLSVDEVVTQASGTPTALLFASPQFIFVDATDQLFFDADGIGALSAPVVVAVIARPWTQLIASKFAWSRA